MAVLRRFLLGFDGSPEARSVKSFANARRALGQAAEKGAGVHYVYVPFEFSDNHQTAEQMQPDEATNELGPINVSEQSATEINEGQLGQTALRLVRLRGNSDLEIDDSQLTERPRPPAA